MSRKRIGPSVLSAALSSWLVPACVVTLQAQTTRLPSEACAGVPARAMTSNDSTPDLAGIWDFKIDMGAQFSPGMLALGHLDDAYGGSLTPDATNTVVIRRLTLRGDSVHMRVASREGDVLFTGRLGADRSVMCGTVAYHGGQRFTMLATQRRRSAQPAARP